MTQPSGALTSKATWSLAVPTAGSYAVYAWVYPGSNRIRDAHYTVVHAGGSTEVIIDQSIYPETWRYLGTFPFAAGTATVSLDNRSASAETRAVIADAIRLGSGTFDSLGGISLTAPATTYVPNTPPGAAPHKPWWETATFYWGQWMGLDPDEWPYLNDVVARPMYARWYERASGDDAVFISWHTNGSAGTARGTVTYVHNGETYPRTAGSTELQAAVHNELVSDIRAGWDPAWTDRGKGQLNLGELRMLYDPTVSYASIPGVLLEIAFHDNPQDALALRDPGFNQLAARAVYQGIVKYFEVRDGVNLVFAPEPPTHLRVENQGAGAVRVAWSASPVDGIGGEAATGYLVYTSPDGFAWGAPLAATGTSATLTGLTEGQTIYVRVTATNAGGESFPTETLGARVGDARLLIVNGFDKLNLYGLVLEDDPVEGENLRMWVDRMNSHDYTVLHGQAVPADYAWDSASNEAVASGAVALTGYDVLDWILGEESSVVDGSFNTTERSLITSYLAAGRSLLVSGSEFGWDLEGQGRDPTFLQTRLHADYLGDDAGTTTARPATGSLFSALGDLHFDAPEEYVVDAPDVLAPLGGAQTALSYVNATTPGAAAVQYAQGCQRLLVLGFPFETLRAAERGPVMSAAMAYLDGCHIDTVIDSPVDQGYYRVSPTFSGRASGDGLVRVELQLQRAGDGAYWTGSAWSSAAAWFPANGTATWSYTLLALSEGGYVVHARSIGEAVDDSPDVVTFGIDRTAPGTPTVVTPTAGVLITGPVISLVWMAPPDTGSPLAYDVAVDSMVRRFAASPAVAPPWPGVHEWRVRAVDAAGNEGPWSGWYAFEVFVRQVFLPLVMR